MYEGGVLMNYQDVKDRLYHGHRKIANNTRLVLARDVPERTECIVMTLHSNVVARFYPTCLKLYSAGHYTRTTKSRLNLALELAGVPNFIRQKDYQWYYGNHNLCIREFRDGMRINYDGKDTLR